MSLPLHDCGSAKLPEHVHSFLKAQSVLLRVDLNALLRDIVVAKVEQDFHAFSLAQEIHSAKGFGEIQGEFK